MMPPRGQCLRWVYAKSLIWVEGYTCKANSDCASRSLDGQSVPRPGALTALGRSDWDG